MSLRLEFDDVKRFTAAAEARPKDLMESASVAFRAMATAAREGDHDGVTASAIVIADTLLQVCVITATNWQEADTKAAFLNLMMGWAWPRHPALGAVLEAARRAESVEWQIE